jgi:ABC-2 type transport system ATP-binding protein
LITLTQVEKRFGKTTAVDKLSLSIPEGCFLGLLGPNGAGKTTLIEMIEGLQTPDKGTIEINGLTWKKHAMQLRELLGISLQETRFMDKVTVWETLLLFASFYRLESKRAEETLELVDLQEKKHAFTVNLSGGQRQRLALAIALLHQPSVLLLDEPTTGLDPHARREVWYLLRKLRTARPVTMVLTTHYMEEAAYLCDRIVILDRGKVLADGTLDALLQTYADSEHIRLKLPDATYDRVAQALQGYDYHWRAEDGIAQLEVPSAVAVLPGVLEKLAAHRLTVDWLECRRNTLDDLFIHLTGRRLDA